MGENQNGETMGEYWERTHPSVYVRIDRLQVWGFAGLMAAGTSPIIGDVLNGWVGWPVFAAGAGIFIYSMIAIGRVR